METSRLTVVSNRLAIVVDREENGQWSIKPGSGGLVTALGPVLRDRGGQWIGWLGTHETDTMDETALEGLLEQGSRETGYTLKPVNLTAEEIQKYYFGFSNEILWPLFHDLPTRCNFDPTYWKVYERVNAKFAQVVAASTSEEGLRLGARLSTDPGRALSQNHGDPETDRFFPPHPLSTAGRVHQAALAFPDTQRLAPLRPGRLPDACATGAISWIASACSCRNHGSSARVMLPAASPRNARCWWAPFPSASISNSLPKMPDQPGGAGSGMDHPRQPARTAADPRRRPPRLHQGHSSAPPGLCQCPGTLSELAERSRP